MDQEAFSEIQFEGQFNRADVLHALQLHLKPSRNELIIRAALILAVIAAFPLYVIPKFGSDPAGWMIWILPGLMALYILALPWVAPYQNAARAMKNEEISGQISGSVTENGIHIHNVRNDSDIPWGNYKGVKKGEGFLLLYQTGRWFNLFPKHFFKSDTDWQRFTSTIEEKIPSKS